MCEWCRLPKFADGDESECICDSPDYELMEECEACGEYHDVDHIRERDDGTFVCPSCDEVMV